MPKVVFQIEGGKPVTVDCNVGDNLLELARRANVAIDAPCSGNGSCGKCRINDLDLGEIDGLPRILDCGQCNDAYSAIKIAFALSEAFDCTVNDLPLTLVLSWYEQKAVCILLTLLYLGIQNMYLGPTIPAFISENVLQVLQKNYNLTPTSEPEKDLNAILQMNH